MPHWRYDEEGDLIADSSSNSSSETSDESVVKIPKNVLKSGGAEYGKTLPNK